MTELMNVYDVARILRVSESTIYRWAKEGYFPPAIRLEKRKLRWPAPVVEKWIKEKMANQEKV